MSRSRPQLLLWTLLSFPLLLSAQVEWKLFNTANSKLDDDVVNRICVDGRDYIWALGSDDIDVVIRSFDGSRWQSHSRQFKESRGYDFKTAVISATIDREGQLLVSTLEYQGLSKFTPQGWIHYPENNEMGEILDIAVDGQNNYWLGTRYNMGVQEIDGPSQHISLYDKLGFYDTVRELDVTDDRQIWFYAYDRMDWTDPLNLRLGRYDIPNDSFQIYTPSELGLDASDDGLSIHDIQSIPGSDAILLLLNNEIYSFEGGDLLAMDVGQEEQHDFFAIKHFRSLNDFWMMGRDQEHENISLFHYFDGQLTKHSSKEHDFLPDVLNDMAIDNNGNVWVATREGVYVFNEDRLVLDAEELPSARGWTLELLRNPIKDHLPIAATSQQTVPLMLQVHSADGRLLWDSEWTIHSGSSRLEQALSLPAGLYVLTAFNSKDGQQQSLKFIKK